MSSRYQESGSRATEAEPDNLEDHTLRAKAYEARTEAEPSNMRP